MGVGAADLKYTELAPGGSEGTIRTLVRFRLDSSDVLPQLSAVWRPDYPADSATLLSHSRALHSNTPRESGEYGNRSELIRETRRRCRHDQFRGRLFAWGSSRR